ncbi:MAG: hypothetical protein GY730_01160 [bacterium]|nr:hypothetical protein [bacterium]
MNGKAVYKFAVNAFVESIDVLLKESRLKIDDIGLIIAHQANKRILDSAVKKSKITPDKFYINIERFGNTSAATIGIALSEASEKNLIKTGDNIMLIGFGSGLVWGGVVIKV